MASAALLGFLKGTTGYALDQAEKREQHEREMEKARFLEKLRLDTQKELVSFQEELAAKRPDDKMSSIDYSAGEYIQRDRQGRETGRRKLTASELEQYKLGRERDSLELENIRSQIADRNERRAIDREQLAIRRRELDLASQADKRSFGSYDVARQLINDHSLSVQDANKAGIPAEEITRLAAASWQNAAARARDGDPDAAYNQAQRYFLEGLKIMRQGVRTRTNEEGTQESYWDPQYVQQTVAPGYKRKKTK